MKQLDYDKIIVTRWGNQFDHKQVEQIRWGLEKGLDVDVYAKPEFSDGQMGMLRAGLEAGYDVSVYAAPELNLLDMSAILREMERNSGRINPKRYERLRQYRRENAFQWTIRN